MEKRGISPVVATVLLVAMVIVIALIIFLWFQGIGGEVITKFGGQNIEIVCNDVSFDAEYSGGELRLANRGIVPIFNFKLRVDKPGGELFTYNINDPSIAPNTWPGSLNEGATYASGTLNGVSGAEKLVVTPVLMGESDDGEKSFMCNEDLHGYEIVVY
jgi:flagellin-like protein